MTVRRAYDEAAKAQRRGAIVASADALLGIGCPLPTAAQIAEAAGLAKGTLYRYFDSLETVFATVLLDRWSDTLAELEAKLSAGISRADAVDAALESFVTLIEGKPILIQLDTMLPDFKRGMSDDARRHFTETLTERMNRTGLAVERALGLAPGRGFQLLIRSNAFIRGLWQSCEVGIETADASADLPSFSRELREALADYWRGALG